MSERRKRAGLCGDTITHQFNVGDVLTLRCRRSRGHRAPHRSKRGYEWLKVGRQTRVRYPFGEHSEPLQAPKREARHG